MKTRHVIASLLVCIAVLAAIVVHEWLTPPELATNTADIPSAPAATPPPQRAQVIEAPVAVTAPQNVTPIAPPEPAQDPDRPSETYLHSRGDDGQHAE